MESRLQPAALVPRQKDPDFSSHLSLWIANRLKPERCSRYGPLSLTLSPLRGEREWLGHRGFGHHLVEVPDRRRFSPSPYEMGRGLGRGARSTASLRLKPGLH